MPVTYVMDEEEQCLEAVDVLKANIANSKVEWI